MENHDNNVQRERRKGKSERIQLRKRDGHVFSLGTGGEERKRRAATRLQ